MSRGLIVICGATATGKTALALEIAQSLNSIIISADSRQVYREFDIGTAKPTPAEQDLIPHYLIDICDPRETLTLAEYQEKAQSLIDKNLTNFPLLVGGTGLYIKSIVKGLKIPRVAPQPRLRFQLEALGQQQCYQILQQVDTISSQKIHPNDQVRTLRALEVFYVTGIPISQQQGENPPTYPIVQIGLDCSTEELKRRIEIRTKKMLEMGFVEEVEKLVKKYGWELPLFKTLGYAEILNYLQGKLSLSEAEREIILHTRQFAKRQRTWFRAYPEIEWFDTTSPDLVENVFSKLTETLGLLN
ncbi:tRNA delta-2-isopentenylpyrophosphate transferase [Crocosphaera subtropica ATCC 51142]|uniref:tRNA dimethylallyltransferase n=1 Tax=Crocosphaera subtropica (strain ATCC 51142 / BH68) TaxID=43989 RepID=MIAA_CROS5|nr:tRNA (adenosine(37)-N6)-dimethylallyltransferase MiaA [Crocosphaera subtropica]B1X0D2.1 RecName: Full=tRNA dimethylallyltransferase; AltName: Full=Dimethylallyl diphosphate:tRNA dimethylallyltransferase; Short=DMAPP:tRNA dimethylallyltransferase; Short=DMATase; AltName: Full=Isopentenyl-diphosphate:tRNA isopentenyltransferase; Short=IPP transferase; Short=IPPT; Short=IPTase [Crocosphaera subtropica ATCC 51142]ACB51221.1 tRNA delta-2-isopentenylpyrophosphate transferase [Crocosphaera subtropica